MSDYTPEPYIACPPGDASDEETEAWALDHLRRSLVNRHEAQARREYHELMSAFHAAEAHSAFITKISSCGHLEEALTTLDEIDARRPQGSV